MLSRRQSLVLILAASLLTAGCTAGDPTSPGVSESPSPPESATAAAGTGTTAGDGRTVRYAVAAGEIPDEFRSVRLTLEVVFVTRTNDFGPCYPEVFDGPYRPTRTPMPTLVGECYRAETVTVNLSDLDGELLLSAAVPEQARGHALIVTDVEATDRNGTAVTSIFGLGGREVLTAASFGQWTVTIGIGRADPDSRYDYWLRRDGSEESE